MLKNLADFGIQCNSNLLPKCSACPGASDNPAQWPDLEFKIDGVKYYLPHE